MVATRFNILPTSKEILGLTDEQLMLIIQHIRNEAIEETGCQDDEFEDWAEDVEAGDGWAQTDEKWVEVPFEEEFEGEEIGNLNAIEKAAKLVAKRLMEDA